MSGHRDRQTDGNKSCRSRRGWGIEKDRKEEREASWEQEGTERELEWPGNPFMCSPHLKHLAAAGC